MTPDDLLLAVPTGLRFPLLAAYTEIARNFVERRWEPSELNGGKFCEVVYSILQGALAGGNYASGPAKIHDMVGSCRRLEQTPENPNLRGDRSLRILIPRALPYLYEIRNNRGVGHAGGEVDPNPMDAFAVQSLASWILAELVRVFHGLEPAIAQEIVDGLVTKHHPLVWCDGDIKRVLNPSLKKSDQLLLLLYSINGWATEEDLRRWVEYANPTVFRRSLLVSNHKQRLLEYDSKHRKAKLTTKGIAEVENRLLHVGAL